LTLAAAGGYSSHEKPAQTTRGGLALLRS
jgi:hypothetical protein